jgi:hypothetical protein
MTQITSVVAFKDFIIVSRKAVKDAISCQLVANSLAFSRRENDTKIASKAFETDIILKSQNKQTCFQFKMSTFYVGLLGM